MPIREPDFSKSNLTIDLKEAPNLDSADKRMFGENLEVTEAEFSMSARFPDLVVNSCMTLTVSRLSDGGNPTDTQGSRTHQDARTRCAPLRVGWLPHRIFLYTIGFPNSLFSCLSMM